MEAKRKKKQSESRGKNTVTETDNIRLKNSEKQVSSNNIPLQENGRTKNELELQRRADELSALQETVLDITKKNSLPVLLNTIVERAARILHATSGGLYLAEPEQLQVRCVVSYNTVRDFRGVVLSYGEGAAGRVAETGRPLLIDDYEKWSGRATIFSGGGSQPFHAVLSVPMIWQGKVTGVIHVLRDEKFTQEEKELLILFANHAAIAVENTRLYESLEKELIVRRQAQDEIQRIEARYKTLIEKASDGVVLVGADGKFKFVSPSTKKMLGYEFADVQFLDPSDLTHPDDLPTVLQTLSQITENPSISPTLQYRYLCKNGNWLWVESTFTNLLNEPNIEAFLINYHNINERKLMDEALLRNEQLSRDLAETALRQAQELTLLDKVRSIIASKLDMTSLLKSVVDTIVETYGYSHVSVYLLEGDTLVLNYQFGYTRVIERIGINEGISGLVARTGQPTLAEDVRNNPYFLGSVENIQSEITVPLLDNGQVTGTLSVESRNKLTETDLKMMVALSADIGIAMGRARLYEDIQRRNRILSALQESTFAIIRHLSLPEALQAILAQAAQLMNTPHGYIYLIQADNTIQMVTGMGACKKNIGMKMQPGEGLSGKVWQTAQSINLPNYHEWEGRSTKFEETPFQSVVGIPLMQDTHIKGVLGLAHLADEKPFTKEDIDLLNHFAQLASIAIENARLYTRAHEELSERKETEEALRTSEQRFRSIFEQSPIGMGLIDTRTGRFLQVNPKYCEIVGRTSAEMLTMSFSMITHPDDIGVDAVYKERLIKGELRSYDFEKRYIRPDDSIVWAHLTVVALWNSLETPLVHLTMVEDISEQKQSEQALQKNEQRLQAFFNQSLDGFFFSDFEEPIEWKHAGNKEGTLEYIINSKRFTEVNDAMLKQYGISREKFLSLTTKDIFAHDLEQGRSLRRQLFNKGHLHLETYERTSGGIPIWFEGDYVCLYDAQERITGYFGIQRDVTDRKKAEENLRESEERYRTLFAGMLDGVYRSTHDGKFVDVNPAMLNMFGYESREEMLALDIAHDLYFAPEERNSLFLDTGQEKVDVFRMKRKDGSEIWVEDHGRYVHDEEGNVIYHEGILRDVTERIRAEDALRRSESFTKSIVENEPECVKIVGKGGKLQYMNPAGLAMIEADSLESLIGKSVYPIVDPNYQQAFADLTDRVLQGEQGTLQFEITGLKGTRRWLETHAVPLYDGSGNIIALLGLTRDITERMHAAEAVREAEKKYRSIFENAVEGIYQSSPEGRFHTVNPAFANMLGFESPQEMINSVVDIAGQIYNDSLRRQDFIQLFNKQDSISGFEYQMRRKDGRLIWVSENARLVRNADGEVQYYEGFLEDITARKQNEQRIDNQLKQLNALHAIDNAINSNFDLRTTLEVLLREVIAQLKADAACVLLFNKDTHTLDYTAGRGFMSKATQHTKLSIGEGYAGRVILDRKTIHISDLTKTENRLTEALSHAGENFIAYIGSPLIAKGQIVGVLEIFQRSPLTPDMDWFDFLVMLADQAAIAIDNAQLFENLQRSNFDLTLAYDATIEGWSRALDLRDKETEGHTQRVTNLTIKLARQMGVPDSEILHIRRGALLHDIGKMGIPDSILNKPETLTFEEWEIMRQHTAYAYEMLSPITYLKQSLDIPRYHHEKWDGTGYPGGLKGEQIPLAARIFAVVDVWDALTSDRSYRSAWPKDKAIEYIQAESGKHFDPKVAKTFLNLIALE
jgi:PAS domain S-box-containing protein/putative nucleotidyltransferase with HDIG domain